MYKRQARYILLQYLKNNFVSNAENVNPIAVETPFSFFIDRSPSRQIALKVAGRIDRVDKIGSNKIEIIDYKTGRNIPNEKELSNNLQLTVYGMAATLVNDNIFNRRESYFVVGTDSNFGKFMILTVISPKRKGPQLSLFS